MEKEKGLLDSSSVTVLCSEKHDYISPEAQKVSMLYFELLENKKCFFAKIYIFNNEYCLSELIFPLTPFVKPLQDFEKAKS